MGYLLRISSDRVGATWRTLPLRILLRAALLFVLVPASASGQTQDFEREVKAAIAGAEAALEGERRRLDELAEENSDRTLSDGATSQAQASSNIYLWQLRIAKSESRERELLDEIGGRISALKPEFEALIDRLSPKPPAPKPPTQGGGRGVEEPPVGPEPAPPPIAMREPLKNEGGAMFQRVLSLPGAQLRFEPGGEQLDAVPKTFTVFYVYTQKSHRGERWLEVGKSLQQGPEGWIHSADAEDWRSMLVMQFPQRVNRKRVLFFEDASDLERIITSFGRAKQVAGLYKGLESGRPDSELLIAAEPADSIASDERPYLMPILDWKSNVALETGDIATLVQVAGLNAQGGETPSGPIAPDGEGPEPPLVRDLNLGIAFVIDTTISMEAYIRTARDIVISFVQELNTAELGDYVDFALVGYRDSIKPDARIGYTSRIYHDFDGAKDIVGLMSNLNAVETSPISTKDWREDAFEGLRLAIEGLSWASDTEAQVVILITDAGARSGKDPMAANQAYDVLNVLDDAKRSGITIIPIHLLTPEAAKNDDLNRAIWQYQSVSANAEGSNYLPMELGDENLYRLQLEAMTTNLREQVEKLSRNEPITPVSDDNILPSSARDLLKAFASDGEPLASDKKANRVPRLAAIIQNELFRAQLDYLGRVRGTAFPAFYRAWASDLDISQPRYQALDVRVFLTRNQLNELAEALDHLLDEIRAAKQTSDEAMQGIQRLSAVMSVDPNRRVEVASGYEQVDDLLPAFLQELPYRSKIFGYTRRDFASASIQLEVIEELESKLLQYRSINEDSSSWLDLGSGDPGEAVYPIELRLLP